MDVERLLAPEESVGFVVARNEDGLRLDRLLAARLPFASRTRVAGWIRAGRARIDGRVVDRAGAAAAAGQRVDVRIEKRPRDADAPLDDLLALEPLARGDGWLAIEKPAGVACHPAGNDVKRTLLTALALGQARDAEPGGPWLPHRLDRETSGVVVVARHRQAMVRLTEIFTSGEGVQKSYLALVKGKMPHAAGTIDLPLSEHEQTSRSRAARGVNFQEAVTRWKVVSSAREVSLLSVVIETGRTHQIRRHLEAVGHPVAGDRRYGDFAWNRQARARWGLRRMALHAWKLTLPHPATGAPLRLEAPLPHELVQVLSRANLPAPPGAALAKTGAPGGRDARRD